MNGVRNNLGEFSLPLTLDLFTDKPLSVYFGPGISTNVDPSGLTVFSLSGGVDISSNNFILQAISKSLPWVIRDR